MNNQTNPADRIRTGKRNPLRMILSGIGVIAIILAGYYVFGLVEGLTRVWTGVGLNPFSAAVSQSDETPEPGVTPTAVLIEETPEPWNGTDRVTMLLMGLDYRDWESGDGPPRTDSMMLLTIDPITMEAGMLSIPRDLWVEVPGYADHYRINTAYFLGDRDRLPGGGPGLAMKTVETLLGVPVQYYAVIDFHAFERMIDEIGGIDVLVTERIKISPIGELSKWLDPKGHHLNGAEALAYARSRKTEGGDFDRAARQQQVALAIIDRILGFDMVPILLAKSPALYAEMAEGVNTNLTLEQMIALGLMVLEIDKKEIARGIIGPPEMVSLHTLPDEAEVLKPVPGKIRELRDQMFSTTGAISPSMGAADPLEAALAENAEIEVLNGSGQAGIAGGTADYLTGLGLNVGIVENADRMDYTLSILFDYSGNPYTRAYLKEIFNLQDGQIFIGDSANGSTDVTIIVGASFVVPN